MQWSGCEVHKPQDGAGAKKQVFLEEIGPLKSAYDNDGEICRSDSASSLVLGWTEARMQLDRGNIWCLIGEMPLIFQSAGFDFSSFWEKGNIGRIVLNWQQDDAAEFWSV